MSVCGQITVGSELRQNKRPNCIQVVLYLLTVACLCVNYVGNMFLLPMVQYKHATLGIVPMKKVKIALNVYWGLVTQSLMVLRNMIYQSVLRVCHHLRLDSKLA